MPRDNQTLLDLYRLMALTRALDGAIAEIDGHWHGLEGEEAVVAGAYHGLRPGDVVAPHYRGSLTAACGRGADLRKLLAGLLGKATSYNRGRYRSDVCGPPEFNLIGLYSGALGPPLAYATGAALAIKLDGRDDVALAVFGDGTSSRGDCHEAMNMASALCLPVVFVCQNNQIAISTPASDGVAPRSVADRAVGYGMPGHEIDGNDVLAVHDTVQMAIARARRGDGPSLIDAVTYRVAGHFVSDTVEDRPPEEIERWRARDPIALFRRYLVEQGVIDDGDLGEIDQAVSAEVAAAMAQAKADPDPGPDVLGLDRVFA
ncbi:MAG: thiamine pyrophosphate-dependent dehydrogenase E1 component subunit alpha [Alphaproteobacteria bacterium]|jgi:TPP-dependent pyruvate/acetoin dehydrogenase alpha subunit|nr:thiamine pyrophosphate-dependent dehydrogenase E1 component subunit alpha [Alphaproteobacteria bacterium]MDP6563386.1 thiamine pyrophosphate-dependent dehydrogenase E1 component subunit alpha [Alphaproteobacteria bacterium]MDP6812132.1 thiamine pyrophosphate-dependent dehydrogenase E1 component subunit alpha [Alphaproteobacteria bacterium]